MTALPRKDAQTGSDTADRTNDDSPARQVAAWIILLARIGYVAKGVLYVTVGVLAAAVALGVGGHTTDSRGALYTIESGPFGTVTLSFIAAGLLGYSVWRLLNAVTDAERRGDDPSGLAIRAGSAVRGLAYGYLGFVTLHFLLVRAKDGGGQIEAITARVLIVPLGTWIVIAAGLGFIGYGCYQLFRAGSDRVLRHLKVHEAGHRGARWIRRFGRFGIASRAVVFGMIGVLLMRAAWKFDPSAAGGIEESLDALARAPRGMLVLGVVAVGLVSYGLFQIATARYRMMRLD